MRISRRELLTNAGLASGALQLGQVAAQRRLFGQDLAQSRPVRAVGVEVWGQQSKAEV